MDAIKHQLIFKILVLSVFLRVGRFECLHSSDIDCPEVCCCQWIRSHWRFSAGHSEGLKADCSRKNLSSVPAGLSNLTTELNLSYNTLKDIPAGAFSHLPSLKELILIHNGIEVLHESVLEGLGELQTIKLQLNSMKEVPQIFHQGLKNLHSIYLDDNLIDAVPTNSFQHIPSLKILTLEGNHLSTVPTEALVMCPNLQRLRLGSNYIKDLTDYIFSNNSQLTNLILSRNSIENLHEFSFAGLEHLTELAITSNPITSVDKRTFANLPALEVLMLSSVKNLEEFPDLEGTHNLDEIILDRCSISSVPDDLCLKMPNLRKLDLHSNSLSTIPNLSDCSSLSNLHLGVNKISSLKGQPFRGLSSILDLTLKNNYITSIPADAFMNLTRLEYLDLSQNLIEYIHDDAFIHFQQLESLNLAHNRFPVLPSKGLENLLVLQTAHNKHLHEIPAPREMPRIQRIVTAYPYHCCEYIGSFIGGSRKTPNMTENHTWLNIQSDWSISMFRIIGDNNHSFYDFDYGSSLFYGDIDSLVGGRFSLESFSSNYGDPVMITLAPPTRNISCIPQPDPFMPCSDLFGSWFLRVGVWLVFLLALIGNGIVILVIVFSRTKVDVSRFLICNLACADFAMGIYLGFLASVDASTLGFFRKYGVDWQLSEGCGAASFLAVFSSELSIYTLCVITLERFYAIKHALHLEKRLKLKHAIITMCFGWVFSLVVASLPLFGVNSYYRYAVCLPFDISTKGALAYVSGLMLLNGFAFVVIMACYISIYCAIQGSHAWNCNDSRVARRMSLLVFTDFACWAPIAFFGLTSAFKLDLITLHGAKILTVFVLPVNSCANPFLYTILTKQFKKDCRVILQWINTNSCTRRNSRSVTLSLARQASLRSTMQHQISQNRCRTSGSGSQEVGVLDPEKLAQKKTDLALVNEKATPEQSCLIREKPLSLSGRVPHHNGRVADPTSHNRRADAQNGRYMADPPTCLGRTDAEIIRRSSTSPLLEQTANKGSRQGRYSDKRRRRKFSMPLWVQKRTSRNSDLAEESTQVNHDPHKQRRRYSAEGIFCSRRNDTKDSEKKICSDPKSNAGQSSKNESNYILDFSKANSNAENEKSAEKSERRSPCSPKRLWRQRSPILKRGGDASEFQGLLDRRESNDIILSSDKKQITTVSLEVTNQDQQEAANPVQTQNSPVQRPDNLKLNWKSADTLDSGNLTGSPSNSERQNFAVSEDSTPITVTPNQGSRPTSVGSDGPYPKILITRLDSFSNVLPDSPTETQRRLDKSRESVV